MRGKHYLHIIFYTLYEEIVLQGTKYSGLHRKATMSFKDNLVGRIDNNMKLVKLEVTIGH